MALVDFDWQEHFDENNDPVVFTDEMKWEWIRSWRNSALTKSDWTQISDNNLSEEQRESWRTYRQALRDLPYQGDPELCSPPEVPA